MISVLGWTECDSSTEINHPTIHKCTKIPLILNCLFKFNLTAFHKRPTPSPNQLSLRGWTFHFETPSHTCAVCTGFPMNYSVGDAKILCYFLPIFSVVF